MSAVLVGSHPVVSVSTIVIPILRHQNNSVGQENIRCQVYAQLPANYHIVNEPEVVHVHTEHPPILSAYSGDSRRPAENPSQCNSYSRPGEILDVVEQTGNACLRLMFLECGRYPSQVGPDTAIFVDELDFQCESIEVCFPAHNAYLLQIPEHPRITRPDLGHHTLQIA